MHLYIGQIIPRMVQLNKSSPITTSRKEHTLNFVNYSVDYSGTQQWVEYYTNLQ